MKVYGHIEGLEYPEPDYTHYDSDKELARQEAHIAKMKAELLKMGYTGKHTGKIFCEPMGDGYAQYMLADGRQSFLVHLPFGDSYHSRNVEYLPKKEVIKRIEASEQLASIFSKRSA